MFLNEILNTNLTLLDRDNIMIFVVGGKGFVGSAIVKELEENNITYDIIQRDNKEEFFGKECDILIYANGNALKYKANEDPFFDFHASVSSVIEYVNKIKCKLFVLISSVDVYDKKSSVKDTKEDVQIDIDKLDNYGFHKYLAEIYVKKFCKKFLIFRLPGLVGPGLKKNTAYDFIHTNKKIMVSPESKFNFMHTQFVAKTVLKIINQEISCEIFNLASKNNIRIGDFKNLVEFDSEFTDDAITKRQDYDINVEKTQKFIDLSTSEEALQEYFRSILDNDENM